MSYSTSDFTDDVLERLVRHGIIDGEKIDDDDPEAQATLALEGIDGMVNAQKQLIAQRRAAIVLKLQMLEALKGVVRVADRQTVEFDAARAAIAKAEAS